jgi:dienelactone hydrolase
LGVLRPRLVALFLVAFTVAGCGASTPTGRSNARPNAGGAVFSYDAFTPLGYVDRGRVNTRDSALAVHDVSYTSGGRRVDGYLVVPPGRGKRPAVVFLHGSGGDRTELLPQAGLLAARGVVTLTITAPSATAQSSATTPGQVLGEMRAVTIDDVVAVRRAVDVLASLPFVDPTRIGYLGWSAGARTGALVAAAEPRLHALVLLSAGAAPISAYAAAAPPALRPRVRQVLGSVDPLHYVARARPGSLLLEDGRRDTVVPRGALLNIIHAAPQGTLVRWYDAPHELDRAAYRNAFAWLMRRLS